MRDKLPNAEHLIRLAAAYRAAGEMEEARILISLSEHLRADPAALRRGLDA